MKYVVGVLAIIYLIALVYSVKGWGHVGTYGGDEYRDGGITYIHVGQSVRRGSVGGVGQRNGGRGGK